MTRRFAVVPVLAAAVLAAGAAPVLAQTPVPAGTPSPDRSLQVSAPVPAPPPGIRLEPTMPLEERGIREQEFYPGPVRSRHEPAFVIPFVTTVPVSSTSSMRVGLSGWTAPALPFDMPQAGGGVAFGLTITWGGPPVETAPPTETR